MHWAMLPMLQAWKDRYNQKIKEPAQQYTHDGTLLVAFLNQPFQTLFLEDWLSQVCLLP